MSGRDACAPRTLPDTTDRSMTTAEHSNGGDATIEATKLSIAFNEAIATMAGLDDSYEIYGQILRALRVPFTVLGLRAMEWDQRGSHYRTVWEGGFATADADLFKINEETLEVARRDNSLRSVSIDPWPHKPQGARSLVLAPLHGGPHFPFRVLLVWVAEPHVLSRPLWLSFLRLLVSVASHTFAHAALRLRLQQQCDLLEDAVESVPLGVLTISSDDRMHSLNRNTEFMFRLRRASVLGQNFREALPQPLAAAISDLLRASRRGETLLDREFDYAIDERTRIRIGISLTPASERPDKSTGFVVMLRDMSLPHEAGQLRQMHEMDLDFVSTLSHELKGPLTSILLGAGMLRESETPLTEGQLQFLRRIEEAVRRLQDLMGNLLDLAKLESRYEEAPARTGDLGALARSVVRNFPNLGGARIRLEVEEPLAEVTFDPPRIQRVLENFLSNALKYSPGDTPEVIVRVAPAEESVKVSVTDRGMGIPDAMLPFVWDKFYRVSSQETASIPGSGLGLAIVRQIITIHGGQVSVESKVGQGSTFSFTIPIRFGASGSRPER